MIASRMLPLALMRPVDASTPAASNIGIDGMGRPNCSANTQKNSTRYPCRVTNCSVPVIIISSFHLQQLGQAKRSRGGDAADHHSLQRALHRHGGCESPCDIAEDGQSQ